MPRIAQVEVFKLAELAPAARTRAITWYRDSIASQDDYYKEAVFDDAVEIATLLGITIARRPIRGSAGAPGAPRPPQEPAIWFSGFYSQGDGACFEGHWLANDIHPGAAIAHAPQDMEITRIASIFERIASDFPDAGFNVTHSGRYYHAGCTIFQHDDVSDQKNETTIDFPERYTRELEHASRDFMRWIYRQLQEAYEFTLTDEAIVEAIEANDYEFTAGGNVWTRFA